MAKTRKTKTSKTKVESIRHKDKRTNIPTEELRDFVAEDEHAPKTMLYPRDPSLDPQLVWKGKDEQDRAGPRRAGRADLHPGEDPPAGHHRGRCRASRRSAGEPTQLDLFADFNGGPTTSPRRSSSTSTSSTGRTA